MYSVYDLNTTTNNNNLTVVLATEASEFVVLQFKADLMYM